MSSRGGLADVICGIGIYTAMAYRKFYTAWISIVLFMFGFLAVIFIFIVFKAKQKSIEESGANKKKLGVKTYIFRILNVAGMILGIFMTVLVVPIGYNRIYKGEVVEKDVRYSDIQGYDIGYAENEFSLTNNFESISKIRFEETWRVLNTEEKLEVLNDIVKCELNYFGITDNEVEIVSEVLDQGTLGSYSNKEKKIRISSSHLENSKPELIMSTMLHEIYHLYLYELVQLYLDSSDSQKRLIVFKGCKEIYTEMQNYQDGKDDFDSYARQYMERSCREYARETLKIYYDEIDEIYATQLVGSE